MRRYLEHIKNTREPHQRRQHAMQVATVLTGGLFVLWLGTLGVRLATRDQIAQSPDQSLTAAAAAAGNQLEAQLQVSTTSVFNN